MAAENINRGTFEQLLMGDKPVLVDYWAPWCTYCRRLEPAYEQAAAEAAAAESEVIFAKVNIDDEPLLAHQQQIEVIPTLVLYQGGKAIDSMVAPESKAAIDAFLNQALQKG